VETRVGLLSVFPPEQQAFLSLPHDEQRAIVQQEGRRAAGLTMLVVGSVQGVAGLTRSAISSIRGARAAANLEANAAKGKAFEAQVAEGLIETQQGVVSQLSVRTASGVATRIDFAARDATAVRLTEAKSSATAPLTTNQRAAFPEIEKTGATVVGAGKPGFPGGSTIPPTRVEVVRPREVERVRP
jgi:filamentous hemagglutinin